MSEVPGLRMMVRVKRRRLTHLEALFNTASLELDEQQRIEQQLLADLMASRDEETQSRLALVRKLASAEGFLPNDVTLLNHLLTAREQEHTKAQQTHKKQESKLQEAVQAKQAARVAVMRGQEQIKVVEDKLQQALDARAKAADDLQDEESEEASVARMLSRQRARSRAGRDVEL